MPAMTRKNALPGLLILAFVLALPGQALAQWKWRDANGKIQYSDLPPPAATPEKDILQRPPGQRNQVVVRSLDAAASAAKPAPAASKPASTPNKAEQEEQAQLKKEQEAAAKKQKDEERRLAEQRADNCRRAAANLKQLQDGGRITTRNEAGETVVLDDAGRAAEIQRTRGLMDSECR